MKKRWLITSFEPFAQAQTNSSQLILQDLEMTGVQVLTPSLPVSFARSWPVLAQALKAYPEIDGVLALGQAEGRAHINLENVALNWVDSRIRDNDGAVIHRAKLVADGPDLHWTNIPWHEGEFASREIVAVPSFSAGVYVCNALFYHLMSWAKSRGRFAGFVHIPLLTTQNEALFLNKPKLDDQLARRHLRELLDFLVNL